LTGQAPTWRTPKLDDKGSPANPNHMANFQRYSAFYDLLYQDKNYAAEAAYVARTIRDILPAARSILELGSGTGRHGRLLAGMGFDMHGIERSSEMVAVAQTMSRSASCDLSGSFSCEVGDICKAALGRSFDAVISLFHVISYQTTNQALQAVFQVAADHLAPGGVFLFDVWHGPAVLSERPAVRVKEVADRRYRVKRTADPALDTQRSTVKVVYHMECEDLSSGAIDRFSEAHLMRYLFPTEVDLLAQDCRLQPLKTEEFLTGQPPSPSTWGVAYVLQR
jgi:SAM-dependent methyltransferase